MAFRLRRLLPSVPSSAVGGGWNTHPVRMRGANRVRLEPVSRYGLLGFRCVAAAPKR